MQFIIAKVKKIQHCYEFYLYDNGDMEELTTQIYELSDGTLVAVNRTVSYGDAIVALLLLAQLVILIYVVWRRYDR